MRGDRRVLQNLPYRSVRAALFLHVAAAIIWIGLGLAGFLLLEWADRTGDRLFAARLHSAIEWLEPAAVVGGPLLLLGSGIGLVLDGPWRFGDLWIALGLGGYAAALAIGAAFEGPQGRRLGAIVRERGADDPEAVALGRRLNALMRLDLAIFAVVVLDMTVKPTADSVGFWTTAAAILAVSGWFARRAYRAAGPEAAAVSPPA